MGDHDPRRHGEDTQAILNRRRFLIESTLAGAGLGALASGCGKEEPQVCLSVVEPPPKPKTGPEPKPCLTPKPDTATPPQPCLSPPPEPQPCLELPPPKKDAKAKGEHMEPCLSVRFDDDK